MLAYHQPQYLRHKDDVYKESLLESLSLGKHVRVEHIEKGNGVRYG